MVSHAAGSSDLDVNAEIFEAADEALGETMLVASAEVLAAAILVGDVVSEPKIQARQAWASIEPPRPAQSAPLRRNHGMCPRISCHASGRHGYVSACRRATSI